MATEVLINADYIIRLLKIDCLFDSVMDWFVPAAARGRNITQSVENADGTQCIIQNEKVSTVLYTKLILVDLFSPLFKHSQFTVKKKYHNKSYLIIQVIRLQTTIAASSIPKLSK
jgi:hypothetical protein